MSTLFVRFETGRKKHAERKSAKTVNLEGHLSALGVMNA